VVPFQVISKQSYKEQGIVSGTVRMSLLEPTPAYRWPDGSAPYCAGVTASPSDHYIFPAPGKYEYLNDGVLASQYPCQYLDAAMAVSNPLEDGAIFMPSRVTMTSAVVSPQPACNTLAHSYCVWNTTATNVTYVADAEMFTLLIDHSFSSPSITRSSLQMSGAMLDRAGNVVDPCAAYANYTAGCPSNVAIGQLGARDILPLKTLLHAGGVSNLDEVASTDGAASLNTSTHRYAGIVVVVNLIYTNYALPTDLAPRGTRSLSDQVVEYYYTVNVIPDQSFKAVTTTTPDGVVPATVRTTYDSHGVRIVVIQQGSIGVYAFQTLLVNMTAALGLLSVAVMITDFLMTSCCPLRAVYRQYKERRTVDFSDLRDALEGRNVLKRFEAEDHLVDPVPAVIRGARARDHGRGAQRRRAAELPPAPELALATGAPAAPAVEPLRRPPATAYGRAVPAATPPPTPPTHVVAPAYYTPPPSAAAIVPTYEVRPNPLAAAPAPAPTPAPPAVAGGPSRRPLPPAARPTV